MKESALHEGPEDLSTQTREMHRALQSLMEELEAVDWYAQRVDATGDEELARVLAHNRDEEKEHACMTLEWIRRRDAGFDEHLRKFLFRDGSLAEQEADGKTADESAQAGPGRADAGLGIGSLKDRRGPGEETME